MDESARGEDFSRRVRDLTARDGVDIVIDCVGTAAFDAMCRSLAVNGRRLLIGQISGQFVPFNPTQLYLRNQSMLSVYSATRR